MTIEETTQPAPLQSRLALTEGTDRILRPCPVDANERLDIGMAGDKGEQLNLYFYKRTNAGATLPPGRMVTSNFVQRLPDARQINMEGLGRREVGVRYLAPATDTTAIVITEAWPERQLNFVNNDHGSAMQVAQLLQLLRARVWGQLQTVKTVAEWRAGHAIECPYEINTANPLAPYQQVALVNAMQSSSYALLMEQGTGKTPVAIAKICNRALEFQQRIAAAGGAGRRLYRVLVVSPKNVQLNWQYELERFATQPGRATVLRGHKMQRLRLFLDAMRDSLPHEQQDIYTVCICSYEMLSNAWELINSCEWDLAILDEGHFIADPSTRRCKYALELRDRSRERMVLTGTPIRNTVFDLYAMWEFLGKGWSGFTTFKAFCRFYGVFERTDDSTGFQKLIGVQNMPFVKERLARTSFITKKAEALPDLPEKVYDTVECEMTDEQQEIYNQVAHNLMAQVEDMLDNQPKHLVVNNILTQLLRLAEITSGYVRWDEVWNPETAELIRPAVVDRFDPNPKLETLVELLKPKWPTQKTIVWAVFVENIKTIRARLELEGSNCVTFYGDTTDKAREEAVLRFNNDPTCRVLVGNPAAGGTGLNLVGYNRDDESSETFCDHVIYYSQNWSAPNRSQSEDRAHRRGTKFNVRYTDICIPNTIDEEIRARVLAKIRLGIEVSDIREIIKRVLQRK